MSLTRLNSPSCTLLLRFIEMFSRLEYTAGAISFKNTGAAWSVVTLESIETLLRIAS